MFAKPYARSSPIVAPGAERLGTWANGVTLLRTIVGLALFALAAIERSPTWNLAGLAVYWGMDLLDGFLARRLNQETGMGAQLDILSDRFLMAFIYLNYLALHPEAAVVVELFLFVFMIVDHCLSNQFMHWQILSPNYFFLVDPTIWRLNWSPPAKLVNSGAVTVLLLVTGSAWVVAPVLAGLYAVKIYSLVRVRRLAPARL